MLAKLARYKQSQTSHRPASHTASNACAISHKVPFTLGGGLRHLPGVGVECVGGPCHYTNFAKEVQLSSWCLSPLNSVPLWTLWNKRNRCVLPFWIPLHRGNALWLCFAAFWHNDGALGDTPVALWYTLFVKLVLHLSSFAGFLVHLWQGPGKFKKRGFRDGNRPPMRPQASKRNCQRDEREKMCSPPWSRQLTIAPPEGMSVFGTCVLLPQLPQGIKLCTVEKQFNLKES